MAHPIAPLPASTLSASSLRQRHGIGVRPVVLCFGFIQIDKGLDVAVRTLARLRRSASPRGRQAVLVVAGEVRRRPLVLKPYEWLDRWHLSRVLRLARRLGVAAEVVTTGYCPAGEVAPWFATADLVLLPYRRAEQSGVAQLAVAAGAATLAAPTGGLREMFEGTPALLPNLRPEAIADCALRVLDSGRVEKRLHGVRAWPGFADLRGLYASTAADAPPNADAVSRRELV
jgi:glycosyltransferase involved in cell wall biosynthesis